MADDKKKSNDSGASHMMLVVLLIGVVGWQVASYQLKHGEVTDTTEEGVVRHLDDSNAGTRPVTWVDMAEKVRRGEFGNKPAESIGGIHR